MNKRKRKNSEIGKARAENTNNKRNGEFYQLVVILSCVALCCSIFIFEMKLNNIIDNQNIVIEKQNSIIDNQVTIVQMQADNMKNNLVLIAENDILKQQMVELIGLFGGNKKSVVNKKAKIPKEVKGKK